VFGLRSPLRQSFGLGARDAAAVRGFLGLERLPTWAIHALLLAVTALISWAVYVSGEAGSPYTIFFAWVAVYAAVFFGPGGTALQTAGMLAGYGATLLLLGDKASTPVLYWALTASALLVLAVAIQLLTARLALLVDRVTEIGHVDSLTGLYNAAGFTQMLENEVERARRSASRLGIVIGEIDDFPAVTSEPMPASQRHVLRSVGKVFRTTPRQIDMTARIGAGRFAMLLPYTDEHGAFLLAERIRERLMTLDTGRVRMSFGVAGFPRAGGNPSVLFQAAEAALAEAHQAGGDRVIMVQRSTSSARVEIDLAGISEDAG
jgi:diguanylate cyclase (GGDEF)-like protein